MRGDSLNWCDPARYAIVIFKERLTNVDASFDSYSESVRDDSYTVSVWSVSVLQPNAHSSSAGFLVYNDVPSAERSEAAGDGHCFDATRVGRDQARTMRNVVAHVFTRTCVKNVSCC